MEIEIKNREDLINLLTWSLEDAPVLNEDLLRKATDFVSEIQSSFTITSEGKLSNNVEDLKQAINYKIADYIFNEFDKIIVTEDEKLIGIKGNRRFELYDGDDRKLYLDASML